MRHPPIAVSQYTSEQGQGASPTPSSPDLGRSLLRKMSRFTGAAFASLPRLKNSAVCSGTPRTATRVDSAVVAGTSRRKISLFSGPHLPALPSRDDPFVPLRAGKRSSAIYSPGSPALAVLDRLLGQSAADSHPSARAQNAAPAFSVQQERRAGGSLAARNRREIRFTASWRTALSVPRTGRDLSEFDGRPLPQVQASAIRLLMDDLARDKGPTREYIRASFGLQPAKGALSHDFARHAHQLSRNRRCYFFARSCTRSSVMLAVAGYISAVGARAFDGDKRLKRRECMRYLARALGMSTREAGKYIDTSCFKDIRRQSENGRPLLVSFGKDISQVFPQPGRFAWRFYM